MGINLTATKGQILRADEVGRQRQAIAEKNGRKDRYGLEADPLKTHINGALCELLVADHYGLEWDPVWDDINRDRADIGKDIEVRSTPYPSGHLLLHPADHDEFFFMLVRGKTPDFEIFGGTYGNVGKKKEYWEDRMNTGRPCYWVPNNILERA